MEKIIEGGSTLIERVEGRLKKLKFGVIHEKVCPTKCGVLIAELGVKMRSNPKFNWGQILISYNERI
jgi:hypothetical protein